MCFFLENVNILIQNRKECPDIPERLHEGLTDIAEQNT